MKMENPKIFTLEDSEDDRDDQSDGDADYKMSGEDNEGNEITMSLLNFSMFNLSFKFIESIRKVILGSNFRDLISLSIFMF